MSDDRFDTPVWPTEIRVARDRRSLTVGFQDGPTLSIPAELLRVEPADVERIAGKYLLAVQERAGVDVANCRDSDVGQLGEADGEGLAAAVDAHDADGDGP